VNRLASVGLALQRRRSRPKSQRPRKTPPPLETPLRKLTLHQQKVPNPPAKAALTRTQLRKKQRVDAREAGGLEVRVAPIKRAAAGKGVEDVEGAATAIATTTPTMDSEPTEAAVRVTTAASGGADATSGRAAEVRPETAAVKSGLHRHRGKVLCRTTFSSQS